MRIGLVDLAGDSGGATTYSLAIRELLEDYLTEIADVTVFGRSGLGPPEGLESRRYVEFAKHSSARVGRWGRKVTSRPLPGIQEALENQKIDIAWCMAPNSAISQIHSPYIVSLWDVGHHDIMGLPEIPTGDDWFRRDKDMRNQVRRATHVFTDSTRTGSNLETLFGLRRTDWDSIGLPLPRRFHAKVEADLTDKFGLEKPFFYYPASSWAHKNHRVLIEALARFAPSANLVFSGSGEPGFDAILRLASEFGVADRVSYVGRVSDSDVASLIDASVGLVMPTILGPTNYPPLEALARGKSVILSDVHEFDELASSGVYVADPFSAERWGELMEKLLAQPERLSSWHATSPHGIIEEVLRRVYRRLQLANR